MASGRVPLVPAGAEAAADALKLSPGILSGGHVFLTGVTGSRSDGQMPEQPKAQFEEVFRKIGTVLAEAGLDHGDIVEMTSYHIDITRHFELFSQVRARFVKAPYPAWTAVEIAGLRRPGALVEVRVIAALR